MDVKSGKANLFIQAQQATSSEDKITEEKKTTATPAPIVSVIAEKKAPVRLSNRLDQKLKTDFAQKKTNNPVLQNATAEHRGEVRGGKQVEFQPLFPFFNIKFRPDWNDLNHKHNIPKTLSTGSGDDKVDIQMGSDGNVHVKVNDKEGWSGTPEQFKYLTIDTGGGNDVVNNSVDGATIMTGEGNDTVKNQASGTNIDTGRGEDKVYSTGYRGDGADTIINAGNHNTIEAGLGEDRVKSTGDDNSTSGVDSLTEKILSENS